MTDTERIEDLRRSLHEANYRYYVLNAPTMSDMEFDYMMHELEALERKHPESADPNSPTQRVGSDLQAGFVQTKHRRPMLSLANTYSEEDIRTWYEQVKNRLGGEYFEVCCELKYDGLSIAITYVDGALERAVTRGDGEWGDDVTLNVRTIKSIPLRLPEGNWPREFEVRGEVLMPWDSFNHLNKKRAVSGGTLFANPRNAAAGTLKLQVPRNVAKRRLDAYIYYLLCDELPTDNHYENILTCADWGFKTSIEMKKAGSIEDIMQYIDYWETERKKLPFATDGIVLKVNSIRQQGLLGETAKAPRWAIAYKYKAESARTQLISVDYQVGRTGAVTPVANMRPVQLSGTVVRRATLNNADYIKSLDLHIGDFVYIEKGGEIIPKIVGVDAESRTEDAVPVEFTTHCPACNAPLVRFPGKVAYYCTNDTGCPAQTKQRIEHFVSREAMNVLGVGKDMVDILYDEGLIHDAADLYDLRLKDLWGDDSRRNKINTAQTIIKGINDSKTTPFPQLVYALGIRFVGEVAAKTLAQHFQSMDNLMAATEEDLLKIDGIGTAVASSVVNYFKNDDNKQLIERLRSHGLRFSLTAEELAERTGKLKDKTFLISGTFRLHTRNEYRQIIEQHGGKNMENVSRFTSYLLVGDEPGPVKLKKAAQLGIPVITEEQFRDMLQLPEGAFGQGVDNPDKPVRKPKQAKTEDNMHEERTLFDA